ncbi:MAG: AAA domain protein [Caudoviricetes sp.]|nr:MAG: AAA domain protein [Caudoviricetes sp.]
MGSAGTQIILLCAIKERGIVMKHNVYLMCGIPGSGKSSFANKYSGARSKVVSRDRIRFELVKPDEPYFSKEKQVFNQFVEEINCALACGYDVYVDATHISIASRNKIIRQLNKCNLACIWLDTPLQECIKRNEDRKGTRAFVPPNVITDMYDKFQKPELYEGFEKIHIVRPDEPIITIKGE